MTGNEGAPVVQAECGSGIDRAGRECLGGSQAVQAHREREGQGHAEQRRTAGIEIGPDRHAGPSSDQATGGRGAQPQVQRHARQDRRHRVARGQCPDLRLATGLQVVGAECSQFTGEFGAAEGLKLVGVQLGAQPVCPGSFQQGAGLGHAEGLALAEHVHRRRQPLARHLRDERPAHLSQVLGPAFRGRNVQQQRRHQRAGEAAGERGDGPQHLQLGLRSQAVTALDLHRRRARVQQGRQARPRQGHEVLFTRGRRGPGGAADAAASRQNLLVGHALHAGLEVGQSVAGPDRVGVRVGERRHHRHAAEVTYTRHLRRVSGLAHPDDPASPHQQSRVLGDAQLVHRGAALRAGQGGDELRDPGEQGFRKVRIRHHRPPPAFPGSAAPPAVRCVRSDRAWGPVPPRRGPPAGASAPVPG